MASVTGMTAESIEELFETMVVSLRVSDTGRLIYKRKDNTEIDAGPIVAPSVAVEKSWPVGSIFISAVPANPNTLLGVGTWVPTAIGRTIVGIDPNDTSFNAAEKAGGAKSVTLTAGQSGLPYHAHSFSVSGNTGGMSDDQVNTTSTPTDTGGSRPVVRGGGNVASNSIDGLNHTHAFSFGGATAAASANAAEAHENMPPFLVFYIWKRTA